VLLIYITNLGSEFPVGETCLKSMSRKRHADAALLPRPHVGWPANVPFNGVIPYPSRIQFVQEDPVFPRFKHATVESMSGNSRRARAGRGKRQAVEGSNGPARKIRRQFANIRFQDCRPAARRSPSPSRSTRARGVNETEGEARGARGARTPEVDDDNSYSREAIQELPSGPG
jgi:hypothetical protein